jgi:hypothetical protein
MGAITRHTKTGSGYDSICESDKTTRQLRIFPMGDPFATRNVNRLELDILPGSRGAVIDLTLAQIEQECQVPGSHLSN